MGQSCINLILLNIGVGIGMPIGYMLQILPEKSRRILLVVEGLVIGLSK